MPKSKAVLAKKLTTLIDKGMIKKTELSRKSGISRVAIDRYLGVEQSATLDILDKLSQALDIPPHEFIKDDQTPLNLPHTVQDCIQNIAKFVATTKAVEFEPAPFPEGLDLDPFRKIEEAECRTISNMISCFSEEEDLSTRKKILDAWQLCWEAEDIKSLVDFIQTFLTLPDNLKVSTLELTKLKLTNHQSSVQQNQKKTVKK